MLRGLFIILGLNPESWEGSSLSDKTRLRIAGIFFIAFLIVCFISGIQFIYAITGSWIAGVPGGILLGLAMANIVRLAMITIVIRFSTSIKPEPEEEPEDIAEVIPASSDSTTNSKNKIDPKSVVRSVSQFLTITEFIRTIFILMVATSVAFPFTAFVLTNKTTQLLGNRRNEIIKEFNLRHPEYSSKRLKAFEEKTNAEHFPIHIYMELAEDSAGKVIVALVMGLAFAPYFMLRNQQRTRSRRGMNGYFSLNREKMKASIIEEHNRIIQLAKSFVQEKYPNTGKLDLDPHAKYLNPPFNTEEKTPDDKDWVSEENWGKIYPGCLK